MGNVTLITGIAETMGGEKLPYRLVLEIQNKWGRYGGDPSSWRREYDLCFSELRLITRPDADNLIKGIKDGCNKVIWHDDSQIVEMKVRKYYSEQRRRAEVAIEWSP